MFLKLRSWINPNNLDLYVLSRNPNAVDLLERNQHKIVWESLSYNPNAIHILEKNLDKDSENTEPRVGVLIYYIAIWHNKETNQLEKNNLLKIYRYLVDNKPEFKGSYGQIFSIEVFSDEMRKQFRRIGRGTFAELTSYYLNESMYQETRELGAKAKAIDEKLGEASDEEHLKILQKIFIFEL